MYSNLWNKNTIIKCGIFLLCLQPLSAQLAINGNNFAVYALLGLRYDQQEITNINPGAKPEFKLETDLILNSWFGRRRRLYLNSRLHLDFPLTPTGSTAYYLNITDRFLNLGFGYQLISKPKFFLDLGFGPELHIFSDKSLPTKQNLILYDLMLETRLGLALAKTILLLELRAPIVGYFSRIEGVLFSGTEQSSSFFFYPQIFSAKLSFLFYNKIALRVNKAKAGPYLGLSYEFRFLNDANFAYQAILSHSLAFSMYLPSSKWLNAKLEALELKNSPEEERDYTSINIDIDGENPLPVEEAKPARILKEEEIIDSNALNLFSEDPTISD